MSGMVPVDSIGSKSHTEGGVVCRFRPVGQRPGPRPEAILRS